MLSIALSEPLDTQRALSIAYTPGVAQVSRAIAADETLAKTYTWADRVVAVVSDGSGVLDLGDIGPTAALPVMEGKCALFKTFGGLDAIPVMLDTKDPDEIVETLIWLRPSFGAVNLAGISAPRCFEIERRAVSALDCPVMHDDQDGTAVVVLAALLGAAEVLKRDVRALKVVIADSGAAGVASANILLARGVRDITVLDGKEILHSGRNDLNSVKADLAQRTNPRALTEGIRDAFDGADVFIDFSGEAFLSEFVAAMAPNSVVFALSTPDPGIDLELVRDHAAIIATGLSDLPNQIDSAVALPGLFRGSLDAGARRITGSMRVAAAEAIFSVAGRDLARDYVLPSVLDPRVHPAVAGAVAAMVHTSPSFGAPREHSEMIRSPIASLHADRADDESEEPSENPACTPQDDDPPTDSSREPALAGPNCLGAEQLAWPSSVEPRRTVAGPLVLWLVRNLPSRLQGRPWKARSDLICRRAQQLSIASTAPVRKA